MKPKSNHSLWGVILILCGIGFAGNALNLWNFSIFFKGWWTLFIIIPCVVSIAQKGFDPVPTTGLIIGILFLLSAWNILPSGIVFKLFFPVMLVLIGCNIVLNNSSQKKHFKDNNTAWHSDSPEYNAVFGGQTITCDNEIFTGASLNSIFGSIDLNLSNAYLQEDIVINCTTIFGGIDIRVPATVNVQVAGVPVFGGIDNKVKSRTPGAPTIFINATCMFGGITIK
ncbi:MAG: hypothetical protein J6B06_04575 [Lachnospiraceae bacterium]|nr:hypothetical protein [Lachnospiraceae bacterium]